jgi:HK97 family phage portal protein
VGWFTDLLFGKREYDALPAPVRMVGFPSDGGLVTAGVTATTALGLSSVWRCLDILSNGVSQLPWREVKGTLDLPLSRIVTRPHGDWTRREWISLLVSTLALYDVAYLLKVGGEDSEGVPMGLLPLDPRIVQPTTVDQFGFVSIFPPREYFVGQTRVSRDQLVILRRSPQPGIDETMGGVIRLARITFAGAIAAEGFTSRFWQGGGVPPGVLETDQKLPTGEGQRYSDEWLSRRQRGPDHWPVVDSGLKAKLLGADLTEASAVEARRELVADIARYFGVPTRIVNAPTGDSETYTSTEGANLDLVRFTLQNYIGAIEDAISDLLPGGRRLVMDTWPITHGPELAMAQAFQLATGGKAWMLPEDVRDRVGLPPVEDPDKLNPPAPAPVIAGGQENGNRG